MTTSPRKHIFASVLSIVLSVVMASTMALMLGAASERIFNVFYIFLIAVAGGFLLGFIEFYLAVFLPPELQEFRDPIGLSLVVVVLLFRPNGLIPAAALKAEKV